MSDLIYIQDAIIELVFNEETKDIKCEDMRKVLNVLKKMPSTEPEIVRCKDCKWGREVCGNIECFVDSNIPPEYHGYEWFCPNGER